ncbi:MAG: hypothetical protein EOO65_04365 [Methanosarcinales archaeon]|nr:MAG: hypothetical protein EOO65_04365 [Methanosarcinales archaeon]
MFGRRAAAAAQTVPSSTSPTDGGVAGGRGPGGDRARLRVSASEDVLKRKLALRRVNSSVSSGPPALLAPLTTERAVDSMRNDAAPFVAASSSSPAARASSLAQRSHLRAPALLVGSPSSASNISYAGTSLRSPLPAAHRRVPAVSPIRHVSLSPRTPYHAPLVES